MHTFLRFRYIFSVLLIHLSLVCQPDLVYSQGNSQFELLPSSENLEPYQAALSNASLEGYRLKDEDRVMAFVSGVEFKLKSAESVLAEGHEIEVSTYASSVEINPAISLVFRLDAEGRLGVTSAIDPRSKLARVGSGYPESLRKVITQSEFDQLPEAKQALILSNPDKYVIR